MLVLLYPFMTLSDNTEIVHSESYFEEGQEKVRIEIERPVDGGFQSAVCLLPTYIWKDVQGFSKNDIDYFQDLIKSVAHVIYDLARNGGFENAANF